MKQVLLNEPRAQLTVVDAPTPSPAEHEVLVRIKVASVCSSTDRKIIAGFHPPHSSGIAGMQPHHLVEDPRRASATALARFYPRVESSEWAPYPAVMGHEAAGEIVQVGAGANAHGLLVDADRPLRVGDRVATFKVHCGFAEYAAIGAGNVAVLPPSLTYDDGSLLEPVMPNYNCLRRCFALAEPSSVLVLGQGFQGLVTTQVARALGADFIIVSEPSAKKRRLAIELGADVAIDPNATDLTDEIHRLTGDQGVDLVAECGGIEATVQPIPYVVRRGGTVAQIGGIEVPLLFDYGYIHFRRITIVPSAFIPTLTAVRHEVAEIFDLVETGQLRLGGLISHWFPLVEVNGAFDLFGSAEDAVTKIAINV